MDAIATDQPAASPAGDAQNCPSCGYDLRGTTSDRCSECGLPIDRAALSISQLPWSRRKEIGRVRAFFRTAWLVFIDSRRIRHELVRPQSPRDASRFRVVVAVMLAIGLVIAVAGVVYDGRAVELLARQRSAIGLMMGNSKPTPGYRQDLLVPWSAGVSSLWLLPIYPIALATYFSGVGRMLHWGRNRSPEALARARAIGVYAVAGSILLLPASACYVGWIALRRLGKTSDVAALNLLKTSALVLTVVFAFAALFSAIHRSGEWVTRANHGGAARFFLAVAEMLLRLAIGLVLSLGVLPWCLGCWRIAIGAWF